MASITKRPNGQWRARYRDPAEHEHSRHFTRRVDAQRWLDGVTTAVLTGAYVDPKSGRQTVREYAEEWRAIQVHRPTTAAHVETMLRRHAYPHLGDRRLSTVRPSDVQTWVKRLAEDLSPATVGVVHRIMSGIFKSAVRDRRIASSPFEGTRLPKVERARIEPLATDFVYAIADTVPVAGAPLPVRTFLDARHRPHPCLVRARRTPRGRRRNLPIVSRTASRDADLEAA